MNPQSSPKEAQGTLPSANAGLLRPECSFPWRFVSALSLATASFAVAACSNTPSGLVGDIGPSAELETLSIRFDEGRGFPFGKESKAESPTLSIDPPTDYLTLLLRNLPW